MSTNRVSLSHSYLVFLAHLNPPKNSKVWKEITIEVLEALKHEVGLEKLKNDYSKVLSLERVDSLFGAELLEYISPQGIIVFQK
jgi:hypothetical protein